MPLNSNWSAIAALRHSDKAIGFKGKLLYDIKPDLVRFKKITSGGVVVMGRKTYEEIGQPLRDRFNVVISSKSYFLNNEQSDLNLSYFNITNPVLLEKYVSHLVEKNKLNIDISRFYVIGGEQIYNLYSNVVNKLYITEIYDTVDKQADSYFPIDYSDWFLSEESSIQGIALKYKYYLYLKDSPVTANNV